MGAVYEALHEAIERRVALKILHPEYARDADVTKRFFNEARAVNRIAHPSLVQISDYGHLPDGTAYIVMEYLGGETLGHRLKRLGGRLAPPTVLNIGWQIATALTAAHDKGIIHRDLKPDNIMIVADQMVPGGERAKLLDFGIAKLAADAKGTQARTRTNVIMGTPLYMSPEQCRGAGIVDAKSDVYSLGVMLYQMLAGRPPFVAEGHGELIGQHLFSQPPPLQELAPRTPVNLVALVHRLLSKDRDARPNMSEVAADLELMQARLDMPPLTAVTPVPIQIAHALQPAMLQPPQHSTLTRSSGQVNRSLLRRSWVALAAVVGIFSIVAVISVIRSTYISPKRYVEKTLSVSTSTPETNSRGTITKSTAATFVAVPEHASQAQIAPGPPAPSSAAGSSPPRPTVVHWSLLTEPPGASVLRADSDEVLGKTPWYTERNRADATLKIRLRYPGFVDKTILFDGNRSMDRTEQLTRVPSPLETPVATGTAHRLRPAAVEPKTHSVKPNAEPAKPRFKVIN